jgi:hypothetical protein
MSQKDLIPFDRRSAEEARAIRSKGGQTRSPAKTLAAKLRWLKKKGVSDEAAQEIYEVMTNPELSALDALIYLRSIRSAAKNPEDRLPDGRLGPDARPGTLLNTNQKLAMADKLLAWHRAYHGETFKIQGQLESVNLDLSYTLTPDDIANIVAATRTRPPVGPEGRQGAE